MNLDYEFAGLPLHVLLVHVIVVAVPALGLALIVAAAWPAARRVLWIPLLIAAAALVPLGLATIEAGKWLEVRVPPAPLIQEHTAQGEDIVPWLWGLLAIAVLIAVWAVGERVFRRRATSSSGDGAAGRRLGRGAVVSTSIVLSIVAIGVTAGSTATLVRVAEAGSRAVWEGSFSDEPLEN
ncbi:hypothetical protein [Agromyces sp. Marseille-P2726]|uniref:hypothetical protein n=1 Tax=Agromyces sp. Marseille-P2726 TaxID=2709132 RepID=UPI00157038D5|nr:hypothetical protein [Agromyces sp. Marseille-P2726]